MPNPVNKWKLMDPDDLDNLFTFEEFADAVQHNELTDDDGNGVWATATHRMDMNPFTDDMVWPSTFSVMCKLAPKDATHVLWFNK